MNKSIEIQLRMLLSRMKEELRPAEDYTFKLRFPYELPNGGVTHGNHWGDKLSLINDIYKFMQRWIDAGYTGDESKEREVYLVCKEKFLCQYTQETRSEYATVTFQDLTHG